MNLFKEKRNTQLETLNLIIKEAKKDKVLREGRATPSYRKEYLAEAHKAVNTYYAYALLEREMRLLSEAASLVAQEDATITFLLKNLAASQAGNEIGQYVHDNFDDMIRAVEDLHRNAGEQERGVVGTPARGAGYGGGLSMGTAGIVRELFGKPPSGGSGSASPIGRPPSGKSGGKPPPVPGSDKKSSSTYGDYMSSTEKGLEKQQNIAGANDQAMATLEKKLPMAAQFLQTYIKVFTDPGMVQKLTQPSKKGFFGGSSKESILKSAFGKFPGFNVALFARDLEDEGAVQDLAQTAKDMQPDVAQIEPVSNLAGKLGQSIKNKLSGFFGSKKPVAA
jgi:hypothetical protein